MGVCEVKDLTPAQKDDISRGKSDCIKGEKHKQFQSRFYDYGYNIQYAIEQALTAQSQGVSK